MGIQSAACAPLYQAFKEGWRETRPIEKKETMAEGIAIAEPVRGRQILEVDQGDGWRGSGCDGKGDQGGPEGDGSKRSLHRAHLCCHDRWIEKVLEKKRRKETVVSTLTGMGLKSAGKDS